MNDKAIPFTHAEHLRTMFALYVRTRPLQQMLSGPVAEDDLRAVFNAGYVEGMWSERLHPDAARDWKRRRGEQP